MFSLIGDRNVLDHMTTFNIASRENMKSAQVIRCPILTELPKAFQEVRLAAFIHLNP